MPTDNNRSKSFFLKILDGLVIGTVIGVVGTIVSLFLGSLWTTATTYQAGILKMDRSLETFSETVVDLADRVAHIEELGLVELVRSAEEEVDGTMQDLELLEESEEVEEVAYQLSEPAAVTTHPEVIIEYPATAPPELEWTKKEELGSSPRPSLEQQQQQRPVQYERVFK